MITDWAFEQATELVNSGIRRGQWLAVNPVTGARWVPGQDRKSVQINQAARALRARETFSPGLPIEFGPLPLTYFAREDLKARGPLAYLVATFAYSLDSHAYHAGHPQFSDYAAAACRSPLAPLHVREAGLESQYEALRLLLVGPGLVWLRPR